MSKKEKTTKPDDFITAKWRPMMGWQYMAVCIFDFIVAPVLWAVVQFWETEAINDAFRQWEPLTLQGAGLYHMAMGAVLGITAWSRGQEKMAGVTGQPAMNTVGTAPSFGGANTAPAMVMASAPSFDSGSDQPMMFRNGKPAPVQPQFPER